MENGEQKMLGLNANYIVISLLNENWKKIMPENYLTRHHNMVLIGQCLKWKVFQNIMAYNEQKFWG